MSVLEFQEGGEKRAMVKKLVSLLAFLFWVGLSAHSGRAQSFNATLSGTVSDPTGAAIPNVALTLRSIATGTESKATSGPDGLYSFPNLRPGIYELRATAKGFKEYLQTGIELTMNALARQDVKLQLGTEVQTVEVRANALTSTVCTDVPNWSFTS